MPKQKQKSQLDTVVCILSFNSGEEVLALLDKIDAQKFSGEFKSLVIDNSTDNVSRDLLEQRQDIELVKISNKEFAHGPTRNLAAEHAKKLGAKYIAYITQDAIPKDEYWLENIIKPLRDNKQAVCCFGSQIAYETANPLVKYWVNTFFDGFRTNGADLVVHKQGEENIGQVFNSNVNSAYKVEFLTEKIPFKDINYAEDQQIAKDLIAAGYEKIFNYQAAVYHSHSWNSNYEYFQRFFDEYRGLKESIGYFDENLGVKGIFKLSLITFKQDVRGILAQDVSLWSKLKWSCKAFVIEHYKHLAIYLGGRYERIEQSKQNLLSREDMQRKLGQKKLSWFSLLKAHIFMLSLLSSFYLKRK